MQLLPVYMTESHYCATATCTECSGEINSTSCSADHVTTALCHLHWLPVQYWTFYKLCLFMHFIHIHKAPSYLAYTLSLTAIVSSCGWLRSASRSCYEQPWMRLKFGQIFFSHAAPAAWNTLPPSLQQLTNNDTFKRQLKTILFEGAFS